MHNIIYRVEEGSTSFTIDQKSETTWIIRVSIDDADTLFHCHAMRVTDTDCYVEIAHAKAKNSVVLMLKCLPLFAHLGFKRLLLRRSLHGKTKVIPVR